MFSVTADTRLSDYLALPELAPYRRYMLYSPLGIHENEPFASATFLSLSQIGWSTEGMVAGADFFLRAVREGRADIHAVYAPEACADDPMKRDVNLIRLSPARPDADRPVVVLCAGGGYQSVCTLVEAIPTARHMVEAGYTVFLMTYRVGVEPAAAVALDDLGQAVRWLGAHAAALGVGMRRYAVGGYSAGGNLVCNWGCAHIGWKKYGAPKPVCLFPIYAVADMKSELAEKGPSDFLITTLGKNWREMIDVYNAVDHIDADYPPCYIVCGRDDAVVPCAQSELIKARLDRSGVPAVLEEGDHAQHGFGDGTDTDVAGWPARALAFMGRLAEEAHDAC